MTIAEKITRAKADYDEVYEAGRKSEYDTFWDAYQDNGNRADYSNAFAGKGWTDETFKPKYDIVPYNAYMIFRSNETNVNLVEYLDNRGVKFDLSQSANTQYMFYGAKFTRIGVVDVKSSNNSTPLDNAFGGNSNLVTIDKIVIKTGSVAEFNTGTFDGCSALENVTFEGLITKNGLNMKDSTKLSKASITSIINCLSTTTNGLSITLSKSAVNNAFAGENLLQVIPNTNTSGTNKTNTIYLTKTDKDAVCGMAEIEGGKSYTIKRNLAGKEWRYFFYDTYPLDTGASSIDGAYLANPYINNQTHTFEAPENAKYVVVRGAEGLTEEEVQNFELTCGVAGSESPEWLNLIATKPNWTINLV